MITAEEFYNQQAQKASKNPFHDGVNSKTFQKDSLKIAHEHFQNNEMSGTEFLRYAIFVLDTLEIK